MDLQDLLNLIGYDNLISDGAYWRTSARYRDGDNKTALRINKRTGEFSDFVEKRSGSIDDLIKLTLKIGNVELKRFHQSNGIDITNIVERDDKPKLVMDKTWDESELTNLQPHFKFYEDRGISKDSLRFFRSGFAHSGSMYQRFVFPIYNEVGKICGWSGRDMTGTKEAKWKHMGRKAAWIYPVFVPLLIKTTTGIKTTYPVLEAIMEKKEVILVESIGDMLALWEHGYKNVIVTFGLALSSRLGAYLMTLGVERVVIAMNNDFEGKINRGLGAAVDIYISLMHYVDVTKLQITLPPKSNDFGEMPDEEFLVWDTLKLNPNHLELYPLVLAELTRRYKSREITESEIQFGKLIKSHYELTEGYQA